MPICPNSDHDGADVPTTREIHYVEPLSGLSKRVDRCEFCAEPFVAGLLRDGITVSIIPTRP